jgi:nitroreductase
MSINPVLEAIKLRRAIRSYEDKQVPGSAIQMLLEAATYAPSANNVQPWKFTVVTNKEEMKRLSDIAKSALVRTLPDVGDEGLMGLKKRLSDSNYNIFYNSALLVFISSVPSPYAVYDCGAAAQNMMLAAYTLGIGSCWIGTSRLVANDPKVKPSLGIPDDHEVHVGIIFGYPKGGFPKAPEKRPAKVLKRID